MATVTLTLTDLHDGNVGVGLTSDPTPTSQADVTDAQRLGFLAHMAVIAASDEVAEKLAVAPSPAAGI